MKHPLQSMDFYPSEFPLEARDRVEKEKILAYRDLLPSNVYDSRKQDLAIQCIMRIFLAFAKEACVLRNEIGWSIDRIQQESNEFRRRLTIMVVHEKFPGLDRQWISNWDGSIESGVERLFKASAEWKQYEELLLAVPVSVGRSEPSTTAEPQGISPAANSGKTAENAESREAVLKPILNARGLSIHDWAKHAKVDFHTAYNYLKGKTKPYPNTLKKLADALGIDVAKLPR